MYIIFSVLRVFFFPSNSVYNISREKRVYVKNKNQLCHPVAFLARSLIHTFNFLLQASIPFRFAFLQFDGGTREGRRAVSPVHNLMSKKFIK